MSENKPFGYKFIEYYSCDDFVVKSSLKGVLLEISSQFPANSCCRSVITPMFDDKTIIDNVPVSDYIKTIEVTSDQIKEIELKVDQEIERNEKYLKSIAHLGVVTGYFGISKGDRGKAIGQEIQNQSKVWDLEKINSLKI